MINIETIINNPENMKLAMEVIEFAKLKKSRKDYQIFALRQTRKNNESYRKRNAILDFFLDNSFINRHQDKLFIDDTSLDIFFENKLGEGNQNLWKIIKEVKPKYLTGAKFNSQKLKEIGDKGEIYIVNMLKEKLPSNYHNSIIHISEFNDKAGYDIKAPSVNAYHIDTFLEVKTTSIPEKKITFFLSRNEYKKSIAMINWYLIFVQIIDSQCHFLGYISSNFIKDKMPEDRDNNIKWQTVKIQIDKEEIINNYP